MQPIVNGLERTYEDRVAFERRNAAEPAHQASLRAYGLRGHPSYVIVDAEGQVLWSTSGPLPAAALQQKIEQLAVP